jgi:predicted dehydrogenase
MNQDKKTGGSGVSRRDFLKSAAVAGAMGAAVLAAPRILHAQNKGDAIRLGVIGTGTEGRVLINSVLKCQKEENVTFTALCDIWPHYRTYTAKLLGKYKQPVTEYADYGDMLDKEKGKIDAVIVATPDWVHHEHAIACMEAGLNVYCEKEMSNTVENAKKMVESSKKTGKLLQIGHQRRSNPRYHTMLDYIQNKKACGRLTNVEGCWNRSKPLSVEWAENTALDPATLKKYGYDSMEHLRNWRWYKKYSGGPIADLGSHQVDIFHWVIGKPPISVMASGGKDNYPKMEWYDNVIAIYEWPDEVDGVKHIIRGNYNLYSTTSNGGYQEVFMGTEGSVIISEDASKGGLRREYTAPEAEWEKELRKTLGIADKAKSEQKKESGEGKAAESASDIKTSHSVPSPGRYYPPIAAPLPPKTEHQPHLENFFHAIRGKEKLNCPGEVGYETAVSILKVNEAVAAEKKLAFSPEEFKV